jgi:hypothetical protein
VNNDVYLFPFTTDFVVRNKVLIRINIVFTTLEIVMAYTEFTYIPTARYIYK